MASVSWIARDLGRMAAEATLLYFRPLMLAWQPHSAAWSWRWQGAEPAEPTRYRDSDTFIDTLQRAVSFNQGALVEYTFLAAEKHKELKTKFNSEVYEAHDIQIATETLMNFLNSRFYEICSENFRFLRELFSAKGTPPRICIKGNFRTSERDVVISIFRDHGVPYDSDTAIENNTGFFHILRNGSYFLENSIPEAAVSGRYRNPRLNVQRLLAKVREKSLESVIEDWDRFWLDFSDDKANDPSFYKSTLIVPLTLWKNDLSEEFLDLVNADQVERFIYGFLCFDHTDIGYFDEVRDVQIGYVFADILSIYAFSRLVYTDFSSTFDRVQKYLDDRSITLEIRKLVDALREEFHPARRPARAHREPIKTSNNRLVPTDDVLLKYARSGENWKSPEGI